MFDKLQNEYDGYKINLITKKMSRISKSVGNITGWIPQKVLRRWYTCTESLKLIQHSEMIDITTPELEKLIPVLKTAYVIIESLFWRRNINSRCL